MAPIPQNRSLRRPRGCSPQYVEIDRPIFVGHLAIIQAQGNVLGFGSIKIRPRAHPSNGKKVEG